jgi:hypothetical protein
MGLDALADAFQQFLAERLAGELLPAVTVRNFRDDHAVLLYAVSIMILCDPIVMLVAFDAGLIGEAVQFFILFHMN